MKKKALWKLTEKKKMEWINSMKEFEAHFEKRNEFHRTNLF